MPARPGSVAACVISGGGDVALCGGTFGVHPGRCAPRQRSWSRERVPLVLDRAFCAAQEPSEVESRRPQGSCQRGGNRSISDRVARNSTHKGDVY